MRRTNRPLAEIAQTVGFADQSHLTSIFRREMGVTPAGIAPRWRELSARLPGVNGDRPPLPMPVTAAALDPMFAE